ncbi:hypothetical protein CAPTEDRAFT_204597 [Capitella teleta]|uniref:Immunoglobulin subtype domain-containing protein n=1 Tax=Capitella teleta TaxID=283909 RepID=R7UYU5_CAPTE|nr:hypothetical protein CAPTEDRAFT_204597 [Capitella teleta]|eukprot:ELU09107.1 hypothetical protein CAPTEDRAFT_204597 [Capitella teleta]
MASWRILFVAFCVLHCGDGHVFESSPGLTKVEVGEDVELRWHTTKELTGDITLYHTSTGVNNKLYKIIFSTHYKHGRCNDCCEYLNGERESAIKIPNVTRADAGKYFIQANNRINDDAVIYVFREFALSYFEFSEYAFAAYLLKTNTVDIFSLREQLLRNKSRTEVVYGQIGWPRDSVTE